MMRAKQRLRACVLGMVLLSGSAALAQVPVNQCGQALNQPGDYVLTTDLHCEGSLAGGISIGASDVHLDTAGHSVGTSDVALSIADGISRVLIDGGGSFFGAAGVVIDAASVTLQNLTIGGTGSFGTGAGVILNGSSHVKVINDTISSNGDCGGGVYVISGTVDHGLIANDTITNNCFIPEAGSGIALIGNRNVIQSNTITIENSFHVTTGINVASDTVVEDNTIALLNNGLLFITSTIGIDITGDSNRVKQNTITGSGADGILAAQGATGNTITKNNVSGNQFDLFDSNGPPCVNTWKRNTFQTSGGAVACIN